MFLLLLSLALAILGIYLFHQENTRAAVILLFFAAFAIRYFMIGLDPFLNDWDERFHALVAKNMRLHPFKPMLREFPIMEYGLHDWCCNHIWLHKQPLFLWQMALSMSIFGVSEVTMRLPSAVMGALLVFPVFRLGKLLFDEKVGFSAALLAVYPYYQLEMTAGAIGMDHNDMAFMFYMTMSIWAFFEKIVRYETGDKPKLRSIDWLVCLIGFLAGCAVLCKWLVGLMVFLGWAVWLAVRKAQKWTFYSDFLVALTVAIATFLPWQLYIHFTFPLESTYERNYNTKHIWEAVENHSGKWYYYFQQLNFQYGNGVWMLIAFGMVLYISTLSTNKPLKWAFLSMIMAVFLFFSLIAQTKMPSYTYCIAPLLWVMIALFLQYFDLKKYNALVLLIVVFAVFRVTEITDYHLKNRTTQFLKFDQRTAKTHNSIIFREINALVPPDYVVFNCKSYEDIDAMFYSDRNCYQWYPTEKIFLEFKNRAIKMAFFNNGLPEYIKNDKDVLLIGREFK
jgi:4-amino-4-deoxy-L-arabinose transferase-like glycosyltransferase